MSLVSTVSKKVGAAAVCVAAVLFTFVLAAGLGAQDASTGDVVDVKSATGRAAQGATHEPRSGSSHATIYYVPDHYGTIQAAVDAVSAGDTIIVRADSYNNGPWAGPVYIAKSITLKSESGAAVTTINGFRNGSTVFLDTAADGELSGFTITNGYASTGGGIHVSSDATIKNNVVTDNEVYDGIGGGIACTAGSSPTIEDNTISDNDAVGNYGYGGGVYCGSNTSPSVTNNTISSNWAHDYGGGVYCESQSSASIKGNTISGNEAQDDGGGIYSHNSYATFEENLIELNQATNYNGGGVYCYGSNLQTFKANTVKNNTAKDDGGGFYLYNSEANTSVESNTITSNTADGDGGGICCLSDSPTIIKNLIESNVTTSNGGGISCYSSSPEISRNTIRSNSAHWGGGIDCDSYSDPVITSNFITENTTTGHGGGIECRGGSSPKIVSNTITLNDAPMFGGGIYSDGYATITNTILWNNISYYPEIYVTPSGSAWVTYCDVEGGWQGTGNMNSNPMFTDGLHLSAFSPCKGQGTNSSQWLPDKDIDGHSRVILFTVDIGADEYYVPISPNWPGGMNMGYTAFSPGYTYLPLWYDDGSTENLLGWTSGGDMCWLQCFGEPDGFGTIEDVQCIYGSAMYPGYTPANGTPVDVFVWDDPTNDGDPSDCVLLASQSGTVQNVDTDIYNVIVLSSPVHVTGEFYVGCCLSHQPGEWAGPMDQTDPIVTGHAWFCGTNTQGAFDPNDLMSNQFPPQEMSSIGLDTYWCLRAGGTYRVIDPMNLQRRK